MPYPYYPTYYPTYPTQMTQPTQNQNQGITWVQGEAGAKSYLVGAGQSVLLMDSESSSFYIKSTDASGIPLPLRIFDYTERTQAQQPSTQIQAGDKEYVTREEFNQWTATFKASLKAAKKEVHDGE